MTVKTIILRGDGVGKEAIAAAAITPGDLVERTSTGTVQRQSSAAAQAQRAFARENEVVSGDIDDAYAADDTTLYTVMYPGAEVYGFITTENITQGDNLVATGDGSLKGTSVVGQVPTSTGVVTDDDSAATNGLVIYAHVDNLPFNGGPICHLESVTAGNADADYDIGAGGPRVQIKDDDAAATAGLQVYFDEDGTNTDERWLVNNTVTGTDLFVPLSDGSMLRIKHDATASTNGVALYFDDDAVNEEARMLFVSPTDTAGSFVTDDDVGMQAYTGPETVLAIALETVANSGGGSKARMKMEII